MLQKQNFQNNEHPTIKPKGFTLVEIMIVVAIIALLAAIAVPGFCARESCSQASRILTDLCLIDSAIDQYAIENNKKSNDPVGTADWTSYVKKGSPLYNTGENIFGAGYGSQTVDQLPQVPSSDYNILSDVAGTGFWSPYGSFRAGWAIAPELRVGVGIACATQHRAENGRACPPDKGLVQPEQCRSD
jgi:prepilin-type N-terminal cleavage/methylation domain-containing protein